MDDCSGSPIDAGKSNRERRSVLRYALIAQIEIIEPASGLCITGRLSEISRKGCYVDLLNTLPVKTVIEVRVSRDQGTFVSRGRVIYVLEGMGMGVEFLEMAGDQSKILGAWLEEFQVS
jgi:hypothetical protein